MQKRILPRGLRNNNPLNIRIGNVWLGEVDNPTDPEFEQFKEMRFGLRAAFVLMRRYIRHYKRTTISAIVAAWAPCSENDTVKYIDNVSRLSGIPCDAQLLFEDKDAMVSIVAAMVVVENGQSIDERVISDAYDIA